MTTPGPWFAIEGDTFNPSRTWGVVKYLSAEDHMAVDGDDWDGTICRTEIIAEVCDGPTDEADARLMAAAPELLRACRLALALLSPGVCDELAPLSAGGPDQVNKAVDALSDAVAKATVRIDSLSI